MTTPWAHFLGVAIIMAFSSFLSMLCRCLLPPNLHFSFVRIIYTGIYNANFALLQVGFRTHMNILKIPWIQTEQESEYTKIDKNNNKCT